MKEEIESQAMIIKRMENTIIDCKNKDITLKKKIELQEDTIINLIVEAGMEMRFCGDSRFFVFLGSKSKFLLA